MHSELRELIELLEKSIATEVHAVQELCFTMISEIVERFDDEIGLLTEAVLNYVLGYVLSDHHSVRELSLQCVIRFLFLLRVDLICGRSIFEFFCRSFSTAQGTNRGLSIIGFSALIYRFRENLSDCFIHILPTIWSLCHSIDPSDPRAQSIAIETIGYCIRFVPDICKDFIEEAIQLFVNNLEFGNRQLLQSAACALKSISKGGHPELLPFVDRIFSRVIAVLEIPQIEKESIDESGLRYSDLQSVGLKLTRQLILQFGRIEKIDQFLATLREFGPFATFWDCDTEFLSTLKICCVHNIVFLHSVFPLLQKTSQVWRFITEVILAHGDLDESDKQMLFQVCCDGIERKEYAALRPLGLLLRRSSTPGFSIESICFIFLSVRNELSVVDICEFVDFFCVSLELGLLQCIDVNMSQQVIQMCLEMIKECVSCTMPPASIRFLNTMILHGFEFDCNSLTIFVDLFVLILQNPSETSEFAKETIVEVFRAILSMISHCQKFTYNWQIFLTALPRIVPLKNSFSVNDLYQSFARLSLTSHEMIPNWNFSVFMFFVNTLAHGIGGLDQSTISVISELISSFLGKNPSWIELLPVSFVIGSPAGK
jgi:hypothetical protein